MAKTKTPKHIRRLLDILSLKRGHCSIGESKFIDQFILPRNPTIYKDSKQTLAYSVTIPNRDGTPSPILWTSHTDTVHLASEDAKQAIIYDADTALIYKSDGKPLGADDGAGVWLMLEMLDAEVPGTYMFFRGEECGGIGSSGMAALHPILFKGFTHAIALDRKDTCSVITHQARGRCCSDEFATFFGNMLSGNGYTLKPDNGGTYTDTAELIDLIGECTNVSVGYFSQHTPSEIQDVEFLLHMRERLCSLTAEALATLPSVRKPGDPDDSWGNYGNMYGWDWQYNKTPAKGKAKQLPAPIATEDRYPADEFDVINMRWRDVVRWVQTAAPEDVADLLCQLAEDLAYNVDAEQLNPAAPEDVADLLCRLAEDLAYNVDAEQLNP